MAENEAIVGELAGFGYGSLRLRDSDILVVQSNRVTSDATLLKMRMDVESTLVRLGVAEPKVLALPSDVTFSVIERS